MNKVTPSSNILLVTGTDTGVGKTIVTALLLSALLQRGVNLEILKPAETGCDPDEHGKLIPSDGEFLRRLLPSSRSVEEIVPYRFRSPVAPLLAAEADGNAINPDMLEEIIRERSLHCDLLVLEGAGGLLVPLTEHYTYADLASRVSASVLLVVGSRLGAINHSLLSLEVLKKRSIDVLGYVLNDLFNKEGAGSVSEEGGVLQAIDTNRSLLERSAKNYQVPEIGFVPHIDNPVDAAVISRASSSAGISEFSQAVIDYFSLMGGPEKRS